jgi:hypothetical protein
LAKAIEDSYGGKLQVMLRKYGNMMLNELESELGKGLAIERKQLRAAITIWLQNTLEMPVLLEDEILETFCQLHNITQDELVAAADRLDLNLAVLDELLAAYLAGYGPNGLGLKTFQ